MASSTTELRIVEPSKNHGRQHVSIVRPARVFSAGTEYLPVAPALGPAYLAAALRENGVAVSAVDALAEGIDHFVEQDGFIEQGLSIEDTVERIDPATTIVGVSCLFTQDWPYIRRLLTAIRDRFPEALIVAGGEHISALPEFCLRDCPAIDLCALGEGEETIVDIARAAGDWSRLHEVAGIAYLQDDRFVKTCGRARIGNVDEIAPPAWDLFPVDVYLSTENIAVGMSHGRSLAILATRGCPYKCTFCSNPSMYGVMWYPRTPARVLDEIEGYLEKYNVENIDFYDLTMVLKRDWILEFCAEIERRGLKFTYQLPSGTRSEVLDDEVSAALYRTGCRYVAYSPESGSKETLDRIKKRVNLDRVIESIKAAQRNGIQVKCNIIIGFPHDTRRDLLKTIAFVSRLAVMGVDVTDLIMFTPYPGTQLFDELRADGLIKALDDDYFRSLAIFGDRRMPSPYCKHISGRELKVWRFIGARLYYAVALLCRPGRFLRLRQTLTKRKCDTILETRYRSREMRARSLRQSNVS